MLKVKRKVDSKELTEEQRELAEENWGLLLSYFIRNKDFYCQKVKRFEDLYYDELVLAYLRAVRGWKSEKGTIGTFAFWCMQRASFQFRKRIPKRIKSLGLRNLTEVQEKEVFIEEDENPKQSITESKLLNLRVLVKKEKRVLELRFDRDLTLKEIGKILDKEGYVPNARRPISNALVSSFLCNAIRKIKKATKGKTYKDFIKED